MRSSARSNSGAGWRRDRTTKPPIIEHRRRPGQMQDLGDVQPHSRPCTMPITRAPTPREASGTPDHVDLPADALGPGLDQHPAADDQTAANATGTLMRNTARQPKASMRSGADRRAEGARPCRRWRPRCRWPSGGGPGGRWPAPGPGRDGNSMAPPTDCTTRPPIMNPMLGGGARGQRAEGEDRHADEEQALAPEEVRSPARHQQQRSHADAVGVEDPRQRGERRCRRSWPGSRAGPGR